MYKIGLILVVLFFYSCKKDKPTKALCVEQQHTIGSFLQRFEFKSGSLWHYQMQGSALIDSFRIYDSKGGLWNNYPNDPNENNYCEKFELYYIGLEHRFFEGGVTSNFAINYDNIFMDAAVYRSSNPKALLMGNSGDSIIYNNNFYCKLENKIDTLTVLGVKYPNVYQMYYYPNWQNFKRIWWCPGVGYIKFEYLNNLNQTEVWELSSYHVIF